MSVAATPGGRRRGSVARLQFAEATHARGAASGYTGTTMPHEEGASMKNGLVRLTEPLVRDDGVLRPASWPEALDRAAGGLRQATERGGGNGVGMFSCSKATNEMNFVAQKFARQVLGTNNIDSCNRT
jgi:formate dehydrogenase (hydrogenase)